MTEQERAERGWPSVARVAYQRGPFLNVAAVPRQRCAQPAAPVYVQAARQCGKTEAIRRSGATTVRAPSIPPAVERAVMGLPAPVPTASQDEKMRDLMRSLYKPRIGVSLYDIAKHDQPWPGADGGLDDMGRRWPLDDERGDGA